MNLTKDYDSLLLSNNLESKFTLVIILTPLFINYDTNTISL